MSLEIQNTWPTSCQGSAQYVVWHYFPAYLLMCHLYFPAHILQGGNRLAELKKDKLFRALPEEMEITDEVLDLEVMEANTIDAMEAHELTTMGKELARELGWLFYQQLCLLDSLVLILACVGVK